MRIFALITDGYGASGGIARYNRELLSSVAASELVDEIIVLPMNGHRCVPAQGLVQLEGISNKPLYILKSLRSCFLKKPAYLFCGHLNLLPLAGFIARLLSIPLWLQIHGIDAWEKPSRPVFRYIKNIALVTSVSRHTRQRFLQWANLDPAKVKILPNTLADRFQPIDTQQARKEFPDIFVTGREKALLTVSRLAADEQYKGHDLVIACLPKLLKNHLELLYLIAGTGDDTQRLVNLAEEFGVAEQVKFLGRIEDSRLASLYSSADVFVMPSTGEGFGIVFLEAMAGNTPAVALNAGGCPDALQDGQLGMLISINSLCSTIHKALDAEKENDLADKVHLAFGRDKFNRHVIKLLEKHLFIR